MKFYIGGTMYYTQVEFFFEKPKNWIASAKRFVGESSFEVMRDRAMELLRGTGLRLPRHGTKQLVEVEIIAKKPRRKK